MVDKFEDPAWEPCSLGGGGLGRVTWLEAPWLANLSGLNVAIHADHAPIRPLGGAKQPWPAPPQRHSKHGPALADKSRRYLHSGMLSQRLDGVVRTSFPTNTGDSVWCALRIGFIYAVLRAKRGRGSGGNPQEKTGGCSSLLPSIHPVTSFDIRDRVPILSQNNGVDAGKIRQRPVAGLEDVGRPPVGQDLRGV